MKIIISKKTNFNFIIAVFLVLNFLLFLTNCQSISQSKRDTQLNVEYQKPSQLVELGLSKLKRNKFQTAINLFTEFLKTDQTFLEVYHYRGYAQYKLNRIEDAIKDLTKGALNHSNKYRFKTWFYNNKPNKTDVYITELSKKFLLEPDIDNCLSLRGLVLYKFGDYDKAILDFSKSIEKNPRNYMAYLYRGYAYRTKGNWIKLDFWDYSINDFTKAIEIYPHMVDAFFGRGRTYFRMNKYDFAIDDFSLAIGLNPNHAESYKYRSLSWFNLNFYRNAIKDAEKAVKVDPKNVDYKSNLIYIRKESKK